MVAESYVRTSFLRNRHSHFNCEPLWDLTYSSHSNNPESNALWQIVNTKLPLDHFNTPPAPIPITIMSLFMSRRISHTPAACLVRVATLTALFSAMAACFAADEMEHTRFTGSLVKAGDDEEDILRRFEVQLLTQKKSHFFHVIDDARSGCPWPESYGRTGPEVGIDSLQPHLVYNYDDNAYLIGLPPLIVGLPDGIEPDTTWEHAGWQMTAMEQRNVENRPAWTIEARERRGRQQTLTVNASTGITLRAEAQIFMGRGEQFALTLTQTSRKMLEQSVTDASQELQNQLLALQGNLKRRPDSHLSELSLRQIVDVTAALEPCLTLAKGTPLELLVKQIKTDAEQQQKRLASTETRAAELKDSDAPEFKLSLMNGSMLESASLAGKTIILHFWDYRDAPLSEPYGQTGYLEYLYNQKKKMNVTVVGVSTNPDLQSKENQNRGRRSVRKLSEFMNLSYPIGHDDGALLKSLGDPRETRGQLPLWVVIDTDGKIAHYHTGFYEVDAALGLKDLEVVLADLLRKK